jgi:NAD(P)-dependent dehydrogenase (short-subunit alcohol dehydrogenase family)
VITSSLSDKKIFISGASSGIGRVLSRDISQHNAELHLTARNEDRLNETILLCKQGTANSYRADLSSSSDMQQLTDSLPVLDGIILNAGVVEYLPVKLISEKKLRDVFSVNFDANVLLVQQLLKKKKIAAGASIIIISSISAHLGVPGTALYAASKAALIAFAKVLASELAPRKIRVNTISPGIVKTAAIVDNNQLSDAAMQEAEKAYPLGYGTAEDITGQVVYLLSDQARWMTGTDIVMDGGFMLQ